MVVWGLLFAAPLLSLYVRTMSDSNAVFNWTEILLVWRKFSVYLLLFLVHNFLLAPLLIHGHKRMAYFSVVAVVLAAFTFYQCNSRPFDKRNHSLPDRPMELSDGHQPPHFDDSQPMTFEDERPTMPDEMPPRADKRPPHKLHRDGPPPIVGERDLLAVMVLILMFGANLGIKGYYRSRSDRKRLAELERQNLEQQLEYLRYQINPHFFMNTLNNIHALVDIDPEKAQKTIVELSKMMRFVLYEGNKQSVPISREFDFIRHYISLMQLRYTEKVTITVDLPQELPDRQIPPLILITFIENAFKHGVSYQHTSFIEVKAEVLAHELHFTCRNSKTEEPSPAPNSHIAEQEGGVGLANVRKRLDLLYEQNYTLSISDNAGVYTVELNIPFL